MAAQYVTGASPVTFISEEKATDGANAGLQYQIPLPLIAYDTSLSAPKGPVDLSNWPPAQASSFAKSDALLAQALIQTMINQGLLTLVKNPDA